MSVAELTEKEINNFEMPEIREGAAIKWYPYGTAERNALLGFVTRVKPRSIAVWTINGLRYENVRHVSDPKLKLNRDQREDGAWDYSDEFKLNEEFKELRELVKKLDARRIAAFEKTIDKQGEMIKQLQEELASLKAQPAENATKSK